MFRSGRGRAAEPVDAAAVADARRGRVECGPVALAGAHLVAGEHLREGVGRSGDRRGRRVGPQRSQLRRGPAGEPVGGGGGSSGRRGSATFRHVVAVVALLLVLLVDVVAVLALLVVGRRRQRVRGERQPSRGRHQERAPQSRQFPPAQ